MNGFLKYDAIPSTVKTSRFRCYLYRLVNKRGLSRDLNRCTHLDPDPHKKEWKSVK
jgi:hypothetical protein